MSESPVLHEGHTHAHTNEPGHSHSEVHTHAHNEHGHSHSEIHAHAHNEHDHSHSEVPVHAHTNEHGHSHSHSQSHRHRHAQSHSSKGDTNSQRKPTYKRSFKERLQQFSFRAMQDVDSKNVAMYTLLKFALAIIQFVFGVYKQNMGATSGSFHTALDCFALFVVIRSMGVRHTKSRERYSYGHARFEVMAAFTSAVYLIFVTAFDVMEATHSFYKPAEFHISDITLSTCSVVVDAIGLKLFNPYASLPITSQITNHISKYSGATPRDFNMHGVFLHVLSDCIVNLGILASVWLQAHSPFISASVSLFVSLFVISSCLPLFQHTTQILLQSTPPYIRVGVEKCVREISFYDGVLECIDTHWWAVTPGETVGTIHIRVRADADEQVILSFVRSLLSIYIKDLTVQIEKDQTYPIL